MSPRPQVGRPPSQSSGGNSCHLVVAALSMAFILMPSTVPGQTVASRMLAPTEQPMNGRSGFAREVAYLSANVALGGLTAALLQRLRGGSFWDPFLGGALGGAAAYAGRRLAVERFDGAGLAGRQVAAVGSSIVRNASDGHGALDQLVLPFGFARLYLSRQGTASLLPLGWRVKLDLPTILTATYLALGEKADLDVGASVSAGALVFNSPERSAEDGWIGEQAAGVIWLRGDPHHPHPDADRSAVLAHERVHVTQYDFSFLTWGDPVEGLLTDRLPGGPWIERHLDLGLELGGWGLANALISHGRRPWEHEARFLTGVSTPR